jgi:chaperonin cofactor prefoldin
MSLLEEKVDSLENHFKVYKSDMNDVKGIVKNIESAMIGNNFNGNKGFVHLLDDVNKRLEKIEDKQILMDENMNNIKFVSKGIITAIIGFFVWLFTSK